ncbi:reverse transcriptase [Gossypium australe]|uniref:Reverse transcriptase n=1 Tax=Gossypium australe TaxID=47621 RepID=A0A5B6UYJ9_9ROSI|nr:reverse transcriptase [Gossypium australe]
MWTSIATAAKILTNGFGWLVDYGTSIEIRNDYWGFEDLNDDSLCPTLLTVNERVDRPQCGKKEETLIHALKDCLTARAILTIGGLDNRLLIGKEEDARTGWERAKTLCHEFRIHNLVNTLMLLITPTCKKWEKPYCSIAKINFDAVVSSEKVGYGVIVRDSDGFVLGGVGVLKILLWMLTGLS